MSRVIAALVLCLALAGGSAVTALAPSAPQCRVPVRPGNQQLPDHLRDDGSGTENILWPSKSSAGTYDGCLDDTSAPGVSPEVTKVTVILALQLCPSLVSNEASQLENSILKRSLACNA
jgi:hypothetical protein